jgi:hypothetical protein
MQVVRQSFDFGSPFISASYFFNLNSTLPQQGNDRSMLGFFNPTGERVTVDSVYHQNFEEPGGISTVQRTLVYSIPWLV